MAVVSSGNATLQGVPFTNYNASNNGKDTFLFSTDCDGNVRWQKTIGGRNGDTTQHLSIYINDNIYVSGRMLSKLNGGIEEAHFDTDVIINTNLTASTLGPHNKTMYLIKYDSNGNFQWLQRPEHNQVESTGV